MRKNEVIADLRRDLATVLAERRDARCDPQTFAARTALRTFQSDRMARVHADLLADPRTRGAAEFLLSDIYGPHDLSERDANLERALPAIERLLPLIALESVAEAIALDALSERLDAAMARRLGDDFSEAGYAEAYRHVGSRADREHQLAHIEQLGASLAGLVRVPMIGKTLVMMKQPARLAGVSHLQGFLERGFEAFRALPEPQSFVTTIVARQRTVMEQLYGGRTEPFSLGQ
jgi:hypothetical protein